jgi:MinD superfamily P-loop ATPase
MVHRCLASSGYLAAVDAQLCPGCGTCGDYCQFEATSVDHGHDVVSRLLLGLCRACLTLGQVPAIMSGDRDPADTLGRDL